MRARELTKAVYNITHSRGLRGDFPLRGQVRRAAVAIMSNIAEGFERGGRSEFHQFLSVAKSSCAELRSHLYVALDARYVEGPSFARLMGQAQEVGHIISGLRVAVRRQRDRSRTTTQSSVHSPQS